MPVIGGEVMGTVLLGAPFADVRGKFGGFVIKKGLSGHYLQLLTYPDNPKTVQQIGKRNNLVTVSRAWRNLTNAQRSGWDALALSPPELDYNRVGQLVNRSGYQWHNRINLRREQVGQMYVPTAPPSIAVDPPDTFLLTSYTFLWGARTDTFNYTTTDFAGMYAILQISVVSSVGRQTRGTGFRSVFGDTVPSAGPQEITSELETVFGWLQVGNRLFGKLWRQSQSGVRSTPKTITVDVLPEP